MIHRLVPVPAEQDPSELLAALLAVPLSAPFDTLAYDCLQALSEQLFRLPELRQRPELVALAFWLRRANLSTYQLPERPDQVRRPRGLAFHITPANVDTLFMYSWALSLLAGNRNLVRLTTRNSPAIETLVTCLQSVLTRPGFERLAAGNAFVRYDHDAAISGGISALADVRIIWGGDATVAQIRALAAKPDTRDIAFPDRQSLAVIAASAWLSESPREQQQLARQFCNDALIFDQLACSSPRLVCWVGEPTACQTASAAFWVAVTEQGRARGEFDNPAVFMRHLGALSEFAAQVPGLRLQGPLQGNRPTVLELVPEQLATLQEPVGGGFFLNLALAELSDLLPLLGPQEQTLSYFGFEPAALRALAQRVQQGLHRIVPIGQALAFGPLWDGYELLSELTRAIVLL